MISVHAPYRLFRKSTGLTLYYLKTFLILVCSALLICSFPDQLTAQEKTHSKKLEKAKVKKQRRKKDKKAAQFQGTIDPATKREIKGNPTKKNKGTSGRRYQERIGTNDPPQGTKGTGFSGKGKRKSVKQGKGTGYKGDPVSTEPRVVGNPTRKKRATGAQYQKRIGAEGPPSGTKGTEFSGKNKPKSVRPARGTNYRGDKVPVETNRIKGNPTKNAGGNAKRYQERTGNQGAPTDTPGTRFKGKNRPKKIPAGSEGTNYAGQSNAGATSTSGGRMTIYGERGANNKKTKMPDIEQRDQGTRWKGDQKASKRVIRDYGGDWAGDQKVKPKVIRDYGGDWSGDQKLKLKDPDTRPSTYAIKGYKSKQLYQGPGTTFRGHLKSSKKIINWDGADYQGDLKVKQRKPDTRASTYAIKGYKSKQLDQGPGTTFQGHLKTSKKIINWDGSDYQGELKVKRNKKIRTEGTTFAGNLRVRPNAKVKTEGTKFEGNYRVRTNKRIRTEGMDFRGDQRVATRFFKNRYLRKKSQEEQLFAGNYKVRRNKGRDMHPSTTYHGGPIKDANKNDEFSRKWKLFWGKTKKNADQPKHLKDKGKKPKYDPKERNIWND